MKRIGFLVASAVVATGLLTGPAVAAPAAAAHCIPESLVLQGAGDESLCLIVSAPSIDPPFQAFAELNGSQSTWCLYTLPLYHGTRVVIAPFGQADIKATFASARIC